MVTLRQMARATLGRGGGAAVSAVYLALSFSLLTAYIAKAHSVIHLPLVPLHKHAFENTFTYLNCQVMRMCPVHGS